MTPRWHRAPTVLQRQLPGGVMLLSLRGGDAVVVSGSALETWDALDEPRHADDVVARLAAAFDEDPASIRADVESVLVDLLGRGLLERTESVGATSNGPP